MARARTVDREHTTTQEIAIVAITRPGALIALRLQAALHNSCLYVPERLQSCVAPEAQATQATVSPRVEVFTEPLADKLGQLFQNHDGLVMFMALGAAFRLLAPYVNDKRADPAVVVVDDSGRFAISALSGHRGGANDLARQVAEALGGQAVITTASDVLGTLKLDMLGRQWGWEIEDESNLTRASAAVVNGQPVAIYQDAGETAWRKTIGTGEAPASWADNIHMVSSPEELLSGDFAVGIIISDRVLPDDIAPLAETTLVYRPRSLVLGIGCKRGTPLGEIEELAHRVLREAGLSHRCIRALASMHIKRDEVGLLQFAGKLGVPADFYSREELDRVAGAPAVCEPAALLCAAKASPTGESALLVNKRKTNRVTVSVAQVVFREQKAVRGKLYVVGLGPGDIHHLTPRARQAIQESQTVVGYTAYLKLIPSLTVGKEVVASGMKEEVGRAAQAMDAARSGKIVSLVSSGDAGIYGMAGLVWELMKERGWQSGKEIDLETVPGVTALNAAASLLGAPLAHDFAVISLSDLLVPWDVIACRLEAAARADLVVVLYNPRSQQRTQQLADAQRLLLQHRSGATPVGIVTNAYRDDQRVAITDLAHLLDSDIGMLTTIIVGNSRTFVYGGKMVTPRGYLSRAVQPRGS